MSNALATISGSKENFIFCNYLNMSVCPLSEAAGQVSPGGWGPGDCCWGAALAHSVHLSIPAVHSDPVQPIGPERALDRAAAGQWGTVFGDGHRRASGAQ